MGRLAHQRLAIAAGAVLVVLAGVSLLAPAVTGRGYADFCCKHSHPPSISNPMGTDLEGRDMLARVLRGVRRSMAVGLVAATVATLVGAAVGAVAGYFRGWVDELVSRSVDVFLVIPELAVLLVLADRARSRRDDLVLVSIAIALVLWPGIARVTRAQFISIGRTGYVEAARASGAPDRRIIVRHLVPNAASPIVVAATLAASWAILAESALSFLGYGPTAPDTSLGSLVERGTGAATTRPWLFYFPGLTLLLVCLCVNFVGDGLREASDPRAELVTRRGRRRPSAAIEDGRKPKRRRSRSAEPGQ